jgi:L-ascorbate metabolism protein UlaG (beta-lactamase superfamily)
VLTAPELPDAPDEWIARSLGWADAILDRYPPAIPEHPVRRAALIRLDDILHIESAPEKPLVHAFHHRRIAKAVVEIENTDVSAGMMIWKLYNHGFFVRTPEVSFCFDLMRGTPVPGFPVEDALMARLADQADALFISHRHADHADPVVAALFLERGKPVVAVEELWQAHTLAASVDAEARRRFTELASQLTYPRRSADLVHAIPIRNGDAVLRVVAYPGHQGRSVDNNVHLVMTPDGYAVLHAGDQYFSEEPGGDFDWIAQIGAQHKVDVFLPNCWTRNIQRFIRGVNPALVITGHENEMGHTIAHREDYTQTYNHLFGTHYPYLVMSWGESYHYRRD